MTLKVKQGPFRGDKIEYKDGIGCCIWVPFDDDDDSDDSDDNGVAFDFSYDDIDELISLLRKLKLSEATKYGD